MTTNHTPFTVGAQTLMEMGVPGRTATHIDNVLNAHDALTARVAELEAALANLEYAVSGNHALHGLPNFDRQLANARAVLGYRVGPTDTRPLAQS